MIAADKKEPPKPRAAVPACPRCGCSMHVRGQRAGGLVRYRYCTNPDCPESMKIGPGKRSAGQS